MALFTHWKHNIDPIALQLPDIFPEFIGSIGIRWYGIAYMLGFVIAIVLLNFYHKKNRSPLNAEQQSNAMLAVIIGVIAGGRLGYMLLYDFSSFINNPIIIFKVWEGGMASHGGFVGVTIAILWIARQTQNPLLKISDIFVTLVPPGLLLGRIANFINGELWGKETNVPWAVRFQETFNGDYGPPRHPSQLYEAALEGAILFIYIQLRFWKSKPHYRVVGQITGEFLIAYALLRIIGEVFREPDAGLILGLSRGIFYSLFLIIGGIVVILIAQRTYRNGLE